MGNKLSSSNRYLRDAKRRKKALWVSVKSSSAVEGIRAPFKDKAAFLRGLERPFVSKVKHVSQRQLQKLDARLRAAELKARGEHPGRPGLVFLDPRRVRVKIVGSVDRF